MQTLCIHIYQLSVSLMAMRSQLPEHDTREFNKIRTEGRSETLRSASDLDEQHKQANA